MVVEEVGLVGTMMVPILRGERSVTIATLLIRFSALNRETICITLNVFFFLYVLVFVCFDF